MSLKDFIMILLILLVACFNTVYTNRSMDNVGYLVSQNLKTIDLNSVVDGYQKLLMSELEEGRLDAETMITLTTEFMTNLQRALSEQQGIVIISQAVIIGGNDVTEEVKRSLYQ